MVRTMLAVGNYRFSINDAVYDRLNRRSGWQWPSLGRIGRAPALQFTGPEAETVNIEGVFYPHWGPAQGKNEPQRMRDEGGRGEPLMVVDGRGHVWGRFVITSFEEGHQAILDNGAPREVPFKMALTRYGEDES